MDEYVSFVIGEIEDARRECQSPVLLVEQRIRLYRVRVECAVEGAELNGVRRSLGRKGRVEVEQMISAGVVVLLCAPPPVGACTAGAGVPEPGEGFHRRGLAPIQLGKKPRLNRAAPAPASVGRDAQGHGQQIFLGVYDVHQPPQALRGVLAEADVDVDAARTVGLRPRRSDSSDHRLYHLDGVGDRAVPLDYPLAPVRHGYVPVAEVVADVAGSRSEVRGDGFGCAFPAYACGFNLDAESLVFHGVCSFRCIAFCFPAGLFARPVRRDTFITPGRRKSNPTKATRFREQISSESTKPAPSEKRFLI